MWCFNNTDIDECATDNGGCEHTCTNMEGSFGCSCPAGYSLTVDGFNCSGKNEGRRKECAWELGERE